MPEAELADAGESRRDTLARVINEAKEADVEPKAEPAEAEVIPLGNKAEVPKQNEETSSAKSPPKGLNGKPQAARTRQEVQKENGELYGKTPAGKERPAAELRAPTSWKPDDREQWTGIPDSAKKVILRRETEMLQGVQQLRQESQQTRQFVDLFKEVTGPYQGMVLAEGSNPLEAVGQLFQTAAALRMGAPYQKASVVANIIKDFGVPVEMIAQALDGQIPQGQTQQQLDPNVLQRQITQGVLKTLGEQRSQVMYERANSEVEEWSQGKEFYDDLRTTMGNLMEAFAHNGQALSLDQAYELAQNAPQHSDVAKIVGQRKEAQRIENARANTQRAKLAGVSVRSQPTGHVDSGPEPGEDRRADIMRAIAANRQR